MSSVLSISIDLSKIEKSRIVEGKNGAKYLDLNLSINDQANDYGKNVSVYHAQSKEERESKVDRSYIGGGKVVWTDGNIATAPMQDSKAKPKEKKQADELPF
jgi:hypothetical protein